MGFEWLTDVSINSITGDVDQGGYLAMLDFLNAQADALNYREIAIFHRNLSGSSWETLDRKAMEGIIIPRTLDAKRTASVVSAEAYTYHKLFDSVPVTGCYFTDDAAGTPHDLGAGATLADVVAHLAATHITVTGGFDTNIDPDSDSTPFGDAYIVPENASLWQAMQRVASHEFYAIFFNRHNELTYKPHPQFAPTVPVAVATLNDTNLLTPWHVEYREASRVYNVTVLGLTSAMQVLDSSYPSGVGVDLRGPRYEIRCETQARLDTLAQRAYEWLAREYTVTVILPGAWDFELYNRVLLTLSGTTANGVTFNWSGKSFWVWRVTYRKLQTFGYVTELVLEEGYTASGYWY